MDLKLVLFVAILIIALYNVEAEFFYNRVFPKERELARLNLKCIPGRTVIRVSEPEEDSIESINVKQDSGEYLRTHMRWAGEETTCQICMCSIEGKDEYCSKRPAMNVNECMRMAYLMEKFRSNEPFDHEKSLSHRIRRDYIWHNDEIPYDAKAKCRRGHSYYSNSINANDTDIDVASDVESLLDYTNRGICYYCVCNMAGSSAGCLSRSPWFCEYFRELREQDAQRDMYTSYLKQDRPQFFRSLSWRLRRTMDNGMFDLMDSGGDALCCDHPSGHRRHLHHQIRNKIQLMKKKVNKENLMSGAPGGDYVDFIVNNDKLGGGNATEFCVPFVSEYSDCTEDNLCSGCSKCTCSAEGKWSCTNVKVCPDENGDYKEIENIEDMNDNDISQALMELEKEIKEHERKEQVASEYPFVPGPQKEDDLLLVTNGNHGELFSDTDDRVEEDANSLEITEVKEINMEDEILKLMRSRRSVDDIGQEHGQNNDTIKFHNAVEELNEDTLKNLNGSGTLTAQKLNTMPQIMRRTSNILNDTSKSLHIEYTQLKDKSHHDDNKVDTLAIHDDKEDLFIHSNMYEVVGNHSQDRKDKELSKMLVNELKGGASETIGDKNAPVISNITFTPENDTLTAMAFIAGNLLNKLWNMEKDSSDDHINTELIKHEKIADLLELFKEPLSMRQEMFLKNTLEQLSTALNNNKDMDDISLCKTLKVKNIQTDEKESKPEEKADCDKDKQKSRATAEALAKINNVLSLINKYENVQNSLDNVKSERINVLKTKTKIEEPLTKDEISSLDLYGKTLEKITKLLIPSKKNKKVVNSIKSRNLFASGDNLNKKLSDLNLDNNNVTAKDKMLLDYLTHIQNNPDCLLKKHKEKATLPTVEGNILLNLSEFFKIKSLSDLVKQFETEKPHRPRLQTSTTQKPIIKATTDKGTLEKGTLQLRDTKERLKEHLKSILEDLVELQKLSGKNTNSRDIQVMEALPCIYNLLNTGKNEIMKSTTVTEKATDVKSSSDKIHEIFSNLNNELKFAQTRRTNSLNGPRPKSAVVWERVIKNARRKQTPGTRRSFGEIPKNVEELKAYLQKIESSGSNTYKNFAFLHEVPPAERLLLLKTFNVDTMKYIKALNVMSATLHSKSSLTKEVERELNEFIDNVAININLNEKVVKNLDKPKKLNSSAFDPKTTMKNKTRYKLVQPIVPKPIPYDTKLTRDQIIHQLIKNRIQLYVETKEADGNIRDDIHYDIAKKILSLLEIGKFELAKELYKVFVGQKHNDPTNKEKSYDGLAREKTNRRLQSQRRPIEVEPLIKFEEPVSKNIQMANQDRFIKQLLNLKSMKL